MTPFAVGMLAAALWLVAIVAMWLLARDSPGPPQRSIIGFRRARRRLAKTARSTATQETLEPDDTDLFPSVEVDAAPTPPLVEQTPPVGNGQGAGTPMEPEMREIQRVLDSISRPELNHPARRRQTSRRKPAKKPQQQKGPIKAGRITYVLFDEEGKPMLD